MRLYIMEMAKLPTGTPVPAYVIATDDGSNVLIDTGLPIAPTGARTGEGLPMGVPEEMYIVSRLGRLGLRPDDTRIVVLTHLDPDHAGGLDAFPEAEIVIQRAAHEAAIGGHPRYAITRPQWGNPDLRFRFVDGDTTLLPGIELIASGGHAPGHQAVLVRLPETGPVLLAIDAIPSRGALDPDTRPIGPFDQDAAAVRASTRKLVDLAAREGAGLIVHGHDAEQWTELKKAPEFYS